MKGLTENQVRAESSSVQQEVTVAELDTTWLTSAAIIERTVSDTMTTTQSSLQDMVSYGALGTVCCS